MRDGAALVPLRATSHTPVPDWLMGMWSEVQEEEYAPSEGERKTMSSIGWWGWDLRGRGEMGRLKEG